MIKKLTPILAPSKKGTPFAALRQGLEGTFNTSILDYKSTLVPV
jgi:hypothetical protein